MSDLRWAAHRGPLMPRSCTPAPGSSRRVRSGSSTRASRRTSPCSSAARAGDHLPPRADARPRSPGDLGRHCPNGRRPGAAHPTAARLTAAHRSRPVRFLQGLPRIARTSAEQRFPAGQSRNGGCCASALPRGAWSLRLGCEERKQDPRGDEGQEQGRQREGRRGKGRRQGEHANDGAGCLAGPVGSRAHPGVAERRERVRAAGAVRRGEERRRRWGGHQREVTCQGHVRSGLRAGRAS